LIAYFIGNISTKKISKSIRTYQSYSKPKAGLFETQSTALLQHCNSCNRNKIFICFLYYKNL